MNVNPWLGPTLLLSALLFPLGLRWGRASSLSPVKLILMAGLAALPALLIAAQYLHVLDSSWYYAFRAYPGTELLAVPEGLSAGPVQGRWRMGRSSVSMLILLALLVGMPHAKPLLYPLNDSLLQERWQDAVCLQSSPSTCGPACAATLLRSLGKAGDEATLARECFSSGRGTENWYLTRALRKRGLRVRYLDLTDISGGLPSPAIAGVRLEGGFGHYVTVLGKTPEGYLLGDPLEGSVILPQTTLTGYGFTGFFMQAGEQGD